MNALENFIEATADLDGIDLQSSRVDFALLDWLKYLGIAAQLEENTDELRTRANSAIDAFGLEVGLIRAGVEFSRIVLEQMAQNWVREDFSDSNPEYANLDPSTREFLECDRTADVVQTRFDFQATLFGIRKLAECWPESADELEQLFDAEFAAVQTIDRTILRPVERLSTVANTFLLHNLRRSIPDPDSPLARFWLLDRSLDEIAAELKRKALVERFGECRFLRLERGEDSSDSRIVLNCPAVKDLSVTMTRIQNGPIPEWDVELTYLPFGQKIIGFGSVRTQPLIELFYPDFTFEFDREPLQRKPEPPEKGNLHSSPLSLSAGDVSTSDQPQLIWKQPSESESLTSNWLEKIVIGLTESPVQVLVFTRYACEIAWSLQLPGLDHQFDVEATEKLMEENCLELDFDIPGSAFKDGELELTIDKLHEHGTEQVQATGALVKFKSSDQSKTSRTYHFKFCGNPLDLKVLTVSKKKFDRQVQDPIYNQLWADLEKKSFRDELLNLARRKGSVDPENIVNQSCLVCYQAYLAEKEIKSDNARPFIRRIVHNKAVDELRRRMNYKKKVVFLAQEQTPISSTDNLFDDTDPQPLLEALENLKPIEKLVLIKHKSEPENLSYEQIIERYQLTTGPVALAQHKRRAKAKLQSWLHNRECFPTSKILASALADWTYRTEKLLPVIVAESLRSESAPDF